MDPQAQSIQHGSVDVPHLSVVQPISTPELLCSHHGTALYLCALMMLGNRALAITAAADSILEVCAEPSTTTPIEGLAMRRDLSARVFGACRRHRPPPFTPQSGLPPSFDDLMTHLTRVARHQRDALALCVYGGHSPAQAATLLGVSAASTHQLLSWGVRDLAALVEPPT